MKKLYVIIALLVAISINAQALFEIKDASDNTVFEIANDGLRVFNLGDTLMVISASEIKANITSSKDKALSRSFSVTTSTTGKAGKANMLEVTTSSTTMREGVDGDEYTDFGPENIFLGLNAGESNSIGMGNILVGNFSGQGNTEGNFNSFLGYGAGYGNTTGSYNTFFGFQAGFSSGLSSYNTAIGFMAGYSLADWQGGTYIGYRAGLHNTGRTNVFIGSDAGYSVTTGQDNVAIGAGAAGSNDFPSFLEMTGSNNTFLGTNSGWKSESGSDNVLVGYQRSDVSPYMTGSRNVYIGYNAGNRSSTGSDNVFLGHYAGYFEAGSDKLYISNSFTTTPLIYGDFNTGRVGFGTKLLTEKVHIYAESGESALSVYAANATRLRVNSDGSVIIGTNSTIGPVGGLGVAGDVGIGTITPDNKLDVFGKVSVTQSAGDEMVIINDNVWNHYYGDQNFGVGGDHFIMASKEGSNESAGIYGDGNNVTIWSPGDAAPGQAAAFLYILDEDWFDGDLDPFNDSALKAYVTTSGVWQVSDKDKKQNIAKIGNAVNKINSLNGYTFEYKINDKEKAKSQIPEVSSGILAQELENVLPEAVQTNQNGEKFVNYSSIIPLLIEGVKEQQNEISALRSEIEEMKKLLNK